MKYNSSPDFLSQKIWTHGQKEIMLFRWILQKHWFLYYWANLVCIALDNPVFQIHFVFSQTFMKMVKV